MEASHCRISTFDPVQCRGRADRHDWWRAVRRQCVGGTSSFGYRLDDIPKAMARRAVSDLRSAIEFTSRPTDRGGVHRRFAKSGYCDRPHRNNAERPKTRREIVYHRQVTHRGPALLERRCRVPPGPGLLEVASEALLESKRALSISRTASARGTNVRSKTCVSSSTVARCGWRLAWALATC
jgi:hypothetical protein